MNVGGSVPNFKMGTLVSESICTPMSLSFTSTGACLRLACEAGVKEQDCWRDVTAME